MKSSFKPEDDDNKEKVDGTESDVDSLAIHCIIQTVSCIDDVRAVNCPHCDGKNKSNPKNWWECDCKNVEMSGCVVVPEDTSINDFVKTVLLKLGYPSASSSFASGSILIRNWKPLPLKTICPGMNKSVGEILKELTAIVSLRIQILRPKITTVESIKDNLLNYLVRTNQNFLTGNGCPFDMSTLLKFCDSSDDVRRQYYQEPSEEMHKKFDAWLKRHEESNRDFDKRKNQTQFSSFSSNSGSNRNSIKNGSKNERNGLVSPVQQHRFKLQKPDNTEKYVRTSGKEENSNFLKDLSPFNALERPKHLTIPKTRIRTSFDPELELPKLHKWYLENPHPSRQQIYEYVSELNALESRKGRKQLDVNNVLYWFKNARAAQKRTECRRLSNVSGVGVANRGNVLKIPLGKTSGICSDDQKSISDDEASVTSETAEEFRKRNDRCLHVVGKWNSNGQGEAVLEMQIDSQKNEFVQSSVPTKKEHANESEETSRSAVLSTDEDSIDPVQRHSRPEKKELFSQVAEEDEKKAEDLNSTEKSQTEIRVGEKSKGGKIKQINGDVNKDEVSSSKPQVRNGFPPHKEDGVANDSNFLSPYKPGFTVSSNLFEHSLMCMSQYVNSKPNNMPLSAEERRKRNRTFIDPVTEVPRLEEWFRLSTHPSHNLIARYTEELNNMPYRRKFPKLETKNVQFWFKNRRAKNKRLNYLEINK